jgi:hypothetical protein
VWLCPLGDGKSRLLLASEKMTYPHFHKNNENLRVEQELKRWRGRAAAESELRHRLEHELNQLKATNQALQLQLQHDDNNHN